MPTFARLTQGLFGLWPRSLTLLILRITLAMPFWASGLTKWDGGFTLSFGATALFTEEYKLHILGQEYPFPYPEQMALASGIAELALPVLLVLGLLTRYAAAGIPATFIQDNSSFSVPGVACAWRSRFRAANRSHSRRSTGGWAFWAAPSTPFTWGT